jgi:membrane-associated phospholipid phosphatase
LSPFLGRAQPALAENPASAPSGPEKPSVKRQDLRHDWPRDGAITFAAGAFWAFTELNKDRIVAPTCRWCDRGPTGEDTLNALDSATTAALGWSNLPVVSRVGDVFAYGIVPLGTLSALGFAAQREDRLSDLPVNILVIAKSLMLYGALNQTVKFIAGRERPFVHELPAREKKLTEHPDDNNVSFFSAHSGTTMCLVVSAGMIARLRGYESERLVWAVGVPLATFTAYSRIAAKKHYLTDVLVGGLVGAAVGFSIPFLFHLPKEPLPFVLAPTSNGLSLSGHFE